MNQQHQDFENAGIPQEQLGAFVDAFFDQLEPKPRKGRPWTFDRSPSQPRHACGVARKRRYAPPDGRGASVCRQAGDAAG